MPSASHLPESTVLKPDEIAKLTAYFRRTFNNPGFSVRARPQKKDSGEVYLGEDFVGVIYRDEEDGELSYNFSMAILEMDLE
jgi:hypothetical protein